MSCPDLGALRASIDHAAPAALRAHVRACAACSATLAELQRNAELAAPAIALTAPADPPPAAAEAALARLQQRRARLAAVAPAPDRAPDPAPEPGPPIGRVAELPGTFPAMSTTPTTPAPGPAGGPTPVPLRRRRPGRLGGRARGAAAALVAALVLVGLVATPGGRAAAGGFLAQFRSQRFQVLTLEAGQEHQVGEVLSELVDTGVFSGRAFHDAGFVEPRDVADLTAASRLAGFPVRPVDPSVLPAGVGPTPQRILVTPAREARITFDRDKALAYLRRHGRPDARLPERYDGTRLVVQVPAVVVQQFAGRDGGPALLVGKAGMLGLDTEGGASLAELREVVLGLPGLPPDTVARLRAIDDWRATLPLPVPAGEVAWRPTTVAGAEALSFEDRSGRLHALLWQRGGHIWGVAGVVGRDEARDVADSLG